MDEITYEPLDVRDFSSIEAGSLHGYFLECIPFLEKCIIKNFANSRHLLKYGSIEYTEDGSKNYLYSIKLSNLKADGIKLSVFRADRVIVWNLFKLMEFDNTESNMIECSHIQGYISEDPRRMCFDAVFSLNVKISKLMLSVPYNFFDKILYSAEEVKNLNIDYLFFYDSYKKVTLIDIMKDGSAIVYSDNFNKYREEILDREIITFI